MSFCKPQKINLNFSPVFLLFVGVLFLLSFETKAQAPGMLEFAGRTVKDNKPLAGATVTVLRNGTIQQEQIKTGKNGKFRFFLVFGSDYKITFSSPGCVDMYLMVYTSKLSKDRGDLFPLYETEVPFFENNSIGVRVDKYKNPFTKVVYDGKKAFKDDEAYLNEFMKGLIIDQAEQAKIQAEKEAKEKAAQEALEKAKKDAEEKAKREAEEKLLAEQKTKEELEKAIELARLKEEAEKQRIKEQNETESMESEAIRLQREREEKALLAKKNKEIKTNYENDLLKMVAENERSIKQQAYNTQKKEAHVSTVIEQMRRENDLKAKADKLKAEQLEKQKLTLENKQYKNQQMRKLVEAAAFAERSVKISNQKTLPSAKNYSRREKPNVAVTVEEGLIKTERTTVVRINKELITYKKESYFWGGVECYKNGVPIDEVTYNVEIDYFLSYYTENNEIKTTKSLKDDKK